MLKNIITSLQSALAGKLPGFQAQQNMLARPRTPVNLPNSPETATTAAVLILLYQSGSEVLFFLTERTHAVENHKGQISLPGGAHEADETLADTARRETWEEIGIAMESIAIIGKLSTLYVPITDFMIHPFVGWVYPEPDPQADPFEVKEMISVSLNNLQDDNLEKQEIRQIRGHEVQVPYFRFGEYKVWGATAMILAEFKHILKAIGVESQ